MKINENDLLPNSDVFVLENGEPTKKKIEISKLVGSDVALGLSPLNSILKSSGLIKRFSNCPKFNILLVKPGFGCSTKKIYSKVKRFTKPKYNTPKKFMFSEKYLMTQENHLEKIVYSSYPKLKKIKSDKKYHDIILEENMLGLINLTY